MKWSHSWTSSRHQCVLQCLALRLCQASGPAHVAPHLEKSTKVRGMMLREEMRGGNGCPAAKRSIQSLLVPMPFHQPPDHTNGMQESHNKASPMYLAGGFAAADVPPVESLLRWSRLGLRPSRDQEKRFHDGNTKNEAEPLPDSSRCRVLGCPAVASSLWLGAWHLTRKRKTPRVCIEQFCRGKNERPQRLLSSHTL